jgi:indolepyruvate ferredoxin oxidoreductase
MRIHLHPPVLRALGLHRKMRVGTWGLPALRLLSALKWLRPTPFDPFRYSRVRRIERALPGEYESTVDAALARLGSDTHAAAVELCGLPDLIRGYEDVKLRNVERYRAAVAEGLTALDARARLP